MDPLAINREVDKFAATLGEWCKKVVKTKETIETTFMSYENVDVDLMKDEILAIIDEGFYKEK